MKWGDTVSLASVTMPRAKELSDDLGKRVVEAHKSGEGLQEDLQMLWSSCFDSPSDCVEVEEFQD